MPDWSSAMTVLNDEIGLIHITDAVAGIVMHVSPWELVSTASYEWGVFAGKREYRWTIWVHLLCRVANVLAYASFVALSSNRTASLCKALSTLGFVLHTIGPSKVYTMIADTPDMQVFSYTATTLSSFLIVLRIIAVWEKQRLISCLSILVWLASAALNFREVSLVFAEWNALGRGCVLVSGRTFIVNVPALLASDTSLLLLLLVGLLRKPGLVRRHGLYRVLLQQDIVWISVVALSTVPMLVLVVLDLNSEPDERDRATDLTWVLLFSSVRPRALTFPKNFIEKKHPLPEDHQAHAKHVYV
ncbi:hypothetical protein OF83DRAFT_1176293 [Amylostereum chailletii]|nr:hypothetical protein OF83DRAFT_1176293 [Amylostereum chailletii]